jgi:hypothetical protein
MQRGKGNKIKTSYASPVKQAFGLDPKTSFYNPSVNFRSDDLYSRKESSLFQPVLFTGVEKKDVSEPGHFDQAMNTPTDQIIKNITSKKTDTKDKKKSTKKDKKKDAKTSGGSGGINPELLLAMTMPFSYAIGKGLSALFGRRKSKTQEIAEDGEKQQNYQLFKNLRNQINKQNIESDKQKIADLSSKRTNEVEPFVDKAPGIAKKQNFKEAFATARKAGKKTFMWNNNKYTTKLKK